MSAFEILNKIDVKEHIEKKGNLSYLSWAWAWAELKKLYPASFYTVYENRDGYFYHTDGRTCWVKTGVTLVDGDQSIEAIEYLPVMNSRNQSIPLDQVTSFDVNKSVQRSLTKAIARHGLGLYIYAGEDLPEGGADTSAPKCADCGGDIISVEVNCKGETQQISGADVIAKSKMKFGRVLCWDCCCKAGKEKNNER